jgi:hypothetical protein
MCCLLFFSSVLTRSLSVYYRIYSENGVVEVRNPTTPEDPFLGRALATQIPPPHTAANIKRYLSRRDHLISKGGSTLFETLYSPFAFDDSEFLDLKNPTGLGSSPDYPVALAMLGELDITPKDSVGQHLEMQNKSASDTSLKLYRTPKATATVEDSVLTWLRPNCVEFKQGMDSLSSLLLNTPASLYSLGVL